LSEYYEILERKTNKNIASNVINLLQFLPNVEFHEVYFKWNLMTNDPDDNKFVDCAISGNVDLIVTNDKHFRILKNIDFPKLHIKSLNDFIKMIENESEDI
jgi:predicted nucleic acid-binding protein